MATAQGLTGLVSPEARVELLAAESTWAEGPCWIPDSRSLRWSDIKGNRILQWSWDTGQTSIYRNDVEHTNGRILDLDGSVLQCSHGLRRVERDREGAIEVIVDSWQGGQLNSPNDLVVASDGAIWFTDPDYGITVPGEGHPGEREYEDCWVFRVDPSDGDVTAVVTDLIGPNGLAFSVDGKTLYVVDSEQQVIQAYDVVDGTTCENSRFFASPPDGAPDGIRVDESGNVWSSSLSGIVVFDPSGAELGSIPVPERTANLCWGGPKGTTLFMTATTGLYRIETITRDAHL